MKLFRYALLFCISFWGINAYADFDKKGLVTITYPTGATKQVPLNFAFKQQNGEQVFVAGKYTVPTEQVPEQYSLAVMLHKDKFAWVQEFGKGYFSEFKYEIDGHVVELIKVPDRDVKGHYVFKLNGKSFLFDLKTVQVVIQFDDNGIKKIKLDGVVKDLASHNS